MEAVYLSLMWCSEEKEGQDLYKERHLQYAEIRGIKRGSEMCESI